MAALDERILWSLLLLLTGAVGQSVNYPPPVCAVRGSTVTLPCSFTPQSVRDGEPVSVKIIRVVWCKNHEICQGSTPSVVDSESRTNNPIDRRYSYLGDKEGNCTLEITDIQDKDKGTFHFRMETNDSIANYTGPRGVNVKVVEGVKPSVSSSSGEKETQREGDSVSLLCSSSVCSFHQLELTWFKDDLVLPESGPALQLGPLTTEDSGNYSCALKRNQNTRSAAYLLQVEAAHTGGGSVLLIAVAVACVLVALAALTLFIIIRRRRAAAETSVGGRDGQNAQLPDNIYCDVRAAPEPGAGPQDDVSYAAVLFAPRNQARPVVGEEDATIYSSVATRG